MSTNSRFSRQIRNGKVVYLPVTQSAVLDQATTHEAEASDALPAALVTREQGAVSPRSKRSVKVSQRRPLPVTLHLGSLTAMGLLLSLGTGLAGVLWLSWQALTNPDVAFWLNQFDPAPVTPISTTAAHPLTLTQIQAKLRQAGTLPGEPIVLSVADRRPTKSALPQRTSTMARPQRRQPIAVSAAQDILIPVSRSACEVEPCQTLRELQIYRSLQLPYPLELIQGKRYYQLLDRFPVQGPTEVELSKQLRQMGRALRSQQALPLEHLQAYDVAPQPGVWLRLAGVRARGQATTTHGQILYFHPEEAQLSIMLEWISPKGQFPVWQQVTGDQRLELLVNQSMGLEPQFSVYQVHKAPRGVRQLRPIQLNQAAFEHPLYEQSLRLARQGLWYAAHQRLRTLKQQRPQQWSAAAQAQMDYIQLHAQVTQTQARQTRTSRVQHIVALLIHGAWSEALDVLQAPRTSTSQVRAMLAGDPGRLWDRVTTTLAIKPGQADAIAWGALLLDQQRDTQAALAWARQQTRNQPTTFTKIEALLEHLHTDPFAKPAQPVGHSPQNRQAVRPHTAPSSSPFP